MAQTVIVQLVDDLDGATTDDISTVTFGVDGASYEIDLTATNADRLRDILGEFVAAARRTGGRRTTTRRQRTTATAAGVPVARTTSNREQTKAIRDWARQNGFDLGDRGRIPGAIVEAFEAAHATNGGGKNARKGRKEAVFSA
jgi:hypothetical protein